MNLLKNPIVVGILAVVAAALVFYRVAWPLMKHSGSQRQNPPAAALSGLPPTTPAPATEKKAAEESAAGKMTGTGMELGTLERDSARWSEARRDPFQRKMAATATNQAKAYPPAMQLLHLKGVWRQSGSTLAVVNDQVITEGDGILAFTVQSIEDTRIWVTGPNGREAVEFKALSAPPPETGIPGQSGASPGNTNQ
jgi:hypothetical protein